MDFVYRFPVVKGIQAGREYYIGMVPLKMISRLFPNEDEFVPPEYRAQRKLNVARIPVISKYILDNRQDYVFSALAASIDGKFSFIPERDNADIGVLEVAMDSRFLINDGQHRKAAILDAYPQMKVEYDSRDDLAVVTRQVVSKVEFINAYTDKERDILGKFSSNLFTLNTFYTANKKIVQRAEITAEIEDFLTKFWSTVADNLVQWNELLHKEISKVDLRENYIITQAVVIQALGRLGHYYFTHPEQDLKVSLQGLQNIDWKRNADQWYLRTIRANGRMINSEKAVILTSNVIKQALGIQLDRDEENRERIFRSAVQK